MDIAQGTYTAWIPAGQDERFAPGSWDSQIGKATRLEVFGTPVGFARALTAEVAADGSGVSLTFEVELESQQARQLTK